MFYIAKKFFSFPREAYDRALSNSGKYFVNCLWTFVFVPTCKSSAAKFTAKKKLESWNGDDFSDIRTYF